MKIPNNVKMVFAGSGPFAEPVFESLAKEFKNLTLILKEFSKKEPEIVVLAKKYHIPYLTVSDKTSFHKVLERENPDVAVVVSFGIIIDKATLDIPKHSFVNVHYSLLPKYRGPSPVQFAILSGDKETGITFQKMAEGIDEGDVLYQETLPISEDDTTETLGRKLTLLSAKKLPGIMRALVVGTIILEKQTGDVSFSKIIQKSDGKIDWTQSAGKIERKVRAYTPWPSAYTFWNGKMLKIIEAETLRSDSSEKTGTFYQAQDGNSGVQTGSGILVVKKLQLEGKKPLATSDFLLGYPKIIGANLT